MGFKRDADAAGAVNIGMSFCAIVSTGMLRQGIDVIENTRQVLLKLIPRCFCRGGGEETRCNCDGITIVAVV